MGNPPSRYQRRRSRCLAPIFTIVSLQALLWPSLFALASTIYMFVDGAVDASMIVPEALYIGAVSNIRPVQFLLTNGTVRCHAGLYTHV